MFAVPNGGYRRPVEAAIMKATGTVAGVPDTIWIKDGRVFAIELKALGGRLSDAQLKTMAEMREAGAVVAVATGIDEALCKLENLGLLRGRAS
jgi:VRR-NUC domain